MGIALCHLSLSGVVSELLALQQRQAPATLCAFPIHVLFAHLHPNRIIVGKKSPSLAHLGSLGKAHCVEVAKNLLRNLDGEGGDEVDF
jgi:hypothetical protein